jgi:hypothetical protein
VLPPEVWVANMKKSLTCWWATMQRVRRRGGGGGGSAGTLSPWGLLPPYPPCPHAALTAEMP